MRPTVHIRVPGAEPGHRGDIIIDGQRATGITGFSIEHDVRSIPRVVLNLVVHEIDYHGEASVHVSDRARDTLIRFGWTPPAEPVTLAKEA
jgi:hypothetical protein